MKRITTAVTIILLLICGCGGGGSQSNNGEIFSFEIGPNEGLTKQFPKFEIEVSPGTFPDGATVEVTIWDNPTHRPPNSTLESPNGLGQFEILTTADPKNDLTIRLPNIGSYAEAWAAVQVRTFGEKQWEIAPEIYAGTELEITLSPNQQMAAGRAFGGLWRILPIIFQEILPVSNEISTHLVAGIGPLGEDSLIVVHGYFDDYNGLRKIAEAAVANGMYDNAYAVSYDYRSDTHSVAENFKNILSPLPRKSIDTISHSRGGILSRYTQEVLNETASVRNSVLVNSPHEGAWATKLAGVYNIIRELIINTSGISSLVGRLVPKVDDPGIKELVAGSSFLRELNSPHEDRGFVNYVAIGGEDDWVVMSDSAMALNTDLEGYTAGKVVRRLLPSDHSFIKKPDGVERILNILREESESEMSIAVHDNPTEGGTHYWSFDIVIRNHSNQSIFLNDLSMTGYDRWGEWTWTQYYDPNTPNGNFYPFNYVVWGKLIPAGGEIKLGIRTWAGSNRGPIAEAEERLKALTSVYRLRYRSQGVDKVVSYDYQTKWWNGIWPAPPRTRSINLDGGGIGLISPAD